MSFLHHMMPILQHMMLVPCHMMLILHHMIFLCHMIIPFLHHMKLFLHHMMPFLYHRFWFWNTVVSSNCTLTPPRAYRAVPLERSYGNRTTFMEDLNKICSKIATVGRKHLLPFPSPRTCWAWQYQLSSAPRSSASSDHMCAGGGPGRVWWWEEWEMWKCEGRGRGAGMRVWKWKQGGGKRSLLYKATRKSTDLTSQVTPRYKSQNRFSTHGQLTYPCSQVFHASWERGLS